MITLLFFGVLSAVAVIIVMMRLNVRRCIGYPVIADLTVTLGLAMLLFGTFAGMCAAIIGGITFSLFITVLRNTIGYERLQVSRSGLAWKRYRGRWTKVPKVKFVLPKITVTPKMERALWKLAD